MTTTALALATGQAFMGITGWAEAPADAFLPVLTLTAKGGLLIALAGLVATTVLRRASAAARHLAWMLGLGAALTLPLLAATLPAWRAIPQAATAAADAGAGGRAVPPASPVTKAATDPASPPAALPTTPGPGTSTSSAAAVANPSQPRRFAAWFVLTWAAVASALLLRLVVGHFNLARLTRRCQRVVSGPLYDELLNAAQRLGLRRRVELLMAPAGAMPMSYGITRPRVVIPAEAESWSAVKLQAVLRHELSHLQRWDPASQTVTQIACALHWVNPLAWVAAHRIHIERERACDDRVLGSGIRGSDYAHLLLEVVTGRTLLAPGSPAAAMSRCSPLESRVDAILRRRENRSIPGRKALAASAVLALAAATPLAMLQAADEGDPAAAENDGSPDPDAADGPDLAGGRNAADGVITFFQKLEISQSEGTVTAVDEKSGKTRWKFESGKPSPHSPVVREDRVYLADENGIIYCLDANDGRLIWMCEDTEKIPPDDLDLAYRQLLNEEPPKGKKMLVEKLDAISSVLQGKKPNPLPRTEEKPTAPRTSVPRADSELTRQWQALVDNRERSLRILRRSYETGGSAVTDVHAAEMKLYEAQLGLARARGDNPGAYAALRQMVDRLELQQKELIGLYDQGVVSVAQVLAGEEALIEARIRLAEQQDQDRRGAPSVPARPARSNRR